MPSSQSLVSGRGASKIVEWVDAENQAAWTKTTEKVIESVKSSYCYNKIMKINWMNWQ